MANQRRAAMGAGEVMGSHRDLNAARSTSYPSRRADVVLVRPGT